VTDPANSDVAELIHHIARSKKTHVNIAVTRPDLLEVVEHSDKLGLTEHLGEGLDWPYLRLTPKGKEAVSESIAAMREIT